MCAENVLFIMTQPALICCFVHLPNVIIAHGCGVTSANLSDRLAHLMEMHALKQSLSPHQLPCITVLPHNPL